MRSVVYTCDRCMDLGEHNFPVLVRDYGPEVEPRHIDLCLNCLHELLDFLDPKPRKRTSAEFYREDTTVPPADDKGCTYHAPGWTETVLPKAKPVCEMDLDKDCPYHPGEHH